MRCTFCIPGAAGHSKSCPRSKRVGAIPTNTEHLTASNPGRSTKVYPRGPVARKGNPNRI